MTGMPFKRSRIVMVAFLLLAGSLLAAVFCYWIILVLANHINPQPDLDEQRTIGHDGAG